MGPLSKLVFISLAVYGLANAIAVLKAGKPIRFFLEYLHLSTRNSWLKTFWNFWSTLFKCPTCLSFWIGMATSYWAVPLTNGLIKEWWLVVIADGLILSATTWILHVVTTRLGYGIDEL